MAGRYRFCFQHRIRVSNGLILAERVSVSDDDAREYWMLDHDLNFTALCLASLRRLPLLFHLALGREEVDAPRAYHPRVRHTWQIATCHVTFTRKVTSVITYATLRYVLKAGITRNLRATASPL